MLAIQPDQLIAGVMCKQHVDHTTRTAQFITGVTCKQLVGHTTSPIYNWGHVQTARWSYNQLNSCRESVTCKATCSSLTTQSAQFISGVSCLQHVDHTTPQRLTKFSYALRLPTSIIAPAMPINSDMSHVQSCLEPNVLNNAESQLFYYAACSIMP